MIVMTREEFQRAYPEELKREYQQEATVKATRETTVKIATRLSRRGDTFDEVIEVTELSREKVEALKAKLDAGSKKVSPAPAAS
jgi:anti-sigma28 factor (negative regulator of flagellin synthesis)